MNKIKIITEQINHNEVTIDVSKFDILSMKKEYMEIMEYEELSVEQYIEDITIGGGAQTEEELEIFDIWEEEHRSEFPNQAVDTTILIDEE